MALGDKNNSGYNNDNDQFTVYSPMSFKNPDAECDPSELSFAYWKNLLKVTISPMKQDADSKFPVFDHDSNNQAKFFLNHYRARMFKKEIEEFLEDPNAYNNRGVVNDNNGFISISNGKEFGVSSPILVIRKVNAETGQIESSYMYQFNNKSYKSIRNFNESDQTFADHTYEDIEIYALLAILDTFINSMTYAQAYATGNTVSKRVAYNMENKINLLLDNAGIDYSRKGGNAYNGKASKSFFAMNKSGQNAAETGIVEAAKQTTIDELASMIE